MFLLRLIWGIGVSGIPSRAFSKYCVTSFGVSRHFIDELALAPPGRESMMATFQSAFRHRLATPEAADPVPITMRSNVFLQWPPLVVENRKRKRLSMG